MKPLLRRLVVLAICCSPMALIAQPRPLVVELFTSQGCSSCPPAEAYLGELSARPDVIALAFHVDYWDELGWHDRFALRQSVQRQDAYARNLRHATVYTPELIIEGRVDALGADRTAVTRALAATRSSGPLTLSVHDGAALIHVGAQPQATRCDVWLVPYLRHARSAVGRGENAGRTLEEFNIVREVRALGDWSGEAREFRVALASLPADSTDLAVLVQRSGQGAIVAALAEPLR
ncbi:MAG TPA: DUF1223 domain-containing protein [Steroidobacteraceae bacterium]|nr:DUF1223 domain-containing protein [Steroidobacteraceae bacterium]